MKFDKEIFSRRESLSILQSQGLVKLPKGIDDFFSDENREANTPWFIRLFIGASAWLSSALFLTFLFSVKAISDQGALPFGVLFLAVAVALSRHYSKNDFLSQLSLAFNFSGQGCIGIGLPYYHLAIWEYLAIFIILELVLFLFFKDAFQKFLSVVSVPFLVAFLFKEWKIEILIHFLIFFQAAYVVFSFEKEEWILSKKILLEFEKPLQYAMIFSLLGLLGFSFVIMNQFLPVPYWYITGVGLTLCMSYFGFSCLDSRRESYPDVAEFGAGIFFVLLVGSISVFAPGIPAAILILLIAFSKKDVLLFGIGILFLIAFLFGYYYNLNLSLLVKSIVLMGSGTFLLLFRFILLRTVFLEEKKI